MAKMSLKPTRTVDQSKQPSMVPMGLKKAKTIDLTLRAMQSAGLPKKYAKKSQVESITKASSIISKKE